MTQTDWLIDYIDAAFTGVALEDGIDIHAAESMDDYGNPEEDRLSQTAERTDWRRVDYRILIPRFWAITFLDAKGFRFYSPAIMTLLLKHGDESNNLGPWFLSAMAVNRSGELKNVRFDILFDNSQRAAIIRFLKHIAYNQHLDDVDARNRLTEIQTRTRPRTAG